MVYLFENEVPEIQEGSVRIVAVAREANPPSRSVGPRTKVAVDSIEREVDPVGACIGARGSRIQQVVNELRGEKIDVIRWSHDPGQYIANSLSPARVEMVRLVDPVGQHAHVLVPPDQLSLAIGREGQNVRLAARLTGWKIDIKNSTEYDQETEDAAVAELITQREQEEALQQEAEERLAAEQAARAEEDARLRELYPLPEDEEDYVEEGSLKRNSRRTTFLRKRPRRMSLLNRRMGRRRSRCRTSPLRNPNPTVRLSGEPTSRPPSLRGLPAASGPSPAVAGGP